MRYISLASALVSTSVLDRTAASSGADCCQSLSSALPSIYYGASTPEYNNLTSSRWSKTSVLHPSCVITPSSAQDVSAAVKILVQNQCKFAVKSGGHNANPGANSINDGVSIDLHGLKSSSLADDRSYVTLGSGLTWGEAYAAFEKQNIGFTGGICEDVGVGGLSVGGGQSLFQASKGWVIDNIQSYEIVLASGDIATVNQDSHPDLFKALKGGNTNLGIVTSINLTAFDFKGLWGGQLLLNLVGPQAPRADMVNRLSKATVDFIAKNDKDLDTGLQVITSYLRGNTAQIIDLAFSNVGNVANPDSLQDFLHMPNQIKNTTRHTSIADIAHETSEAVPKGFRYVTASITIDNDLDTLREVWAASDAVYNGLSVKDKVDWTVSFVPQPTVQQSFAKKSGGNSLGLDSVKNDQIVLWLLSRWDDSSLDETMNAARNKFVDDTSDIAKKHGTFSPFVYINYAGPNQDPLCGYGADNAGFIKETAQKYDPNGVFQTLMPGGFKISQSSCV